MATQDECRALVHREVTECLSSLIYTLAQGYGLGIEPNYQRGDARDRHQAIEEMMEAAMLLATSVDDYESAAREENWTIKEPEGDVEYREFVNTADPELSTSADPDDAEGWKDLCDELRIDPQEREVFEHWAVSKWLAQKLEAKGERVDLDFYGLCVWARTTTGQAILLDHVIMEIVDDGKAMFEEVPLEDFKKPLRKRGIVAVLDKDKGMVSFVKESEPGKEIGSARVTWDGSIPKVKRMDVDLVLGDGA